MDFLQNATDDQLALMGCCVALAASAGLMYVSVFLSRAQRRSPLHENLSRTLTLTPREEQTAASTIEATPRKVA